MSRSDLLLHLARAGSRGDQKGFRGALEAMIADERAKQHHVLADRLADYLDGNASASGGQVSESGQLAADAAGRLLLQVDPRRGLDTLVLPSTVEDALHRLLEEQARRDLLRAHGLEPRHRILLVGPPGNGKTTVAEAIAYELAAPLLVLRYEGVIGRFLGETAVRLRTAFDFVRSRNCVFFIDEFDTLGKERGDPHDTGEIKRVVSSLLLQIDDLPSHVIVVTATNHQELLDRAVWRRFELRLELPPPGVSQVRDWLRKLGERVGEAIFNTDDLASRLVGLSFAELELLAEDVLRSRVLRAPGGSIQQIVREAVLEWQERARAGGAKAPSGGSVAEPSSPVPPIT